MRDVLFFKAFAYDGSEVRMAVVIHKSKSGPVAPLKQINTFLPDRRLASDSSMDLQRYALICISSVARLLIASDPPEVDVLPDSHPELLSHNQFSSPSSQ
ncbi:hypothetical protein AVEN_163117-1 [Araneus ventricosus]|uniref:Uncharacterized protein n=1 Tax=Araneus ventricosus TaxID=182803 RepID=A0A4Y2DJP7_ARAVE|nr:hypothetical protein AVEN_163117-1 [Araneus ventricosus]